MEALPGTYSIVLEEIKSLLATSIHISLKPSRVALNLHQNTEKFWDKQLPELYMNNNHPRARGTQLPSRNFSEYFDPASALIEDVGRLATLKPSYMKRFTGR
jgi:hypothetical protein